MARIGLVSTGITSHLNAAFELARRLREAGHDLCFASGLPRAAGLVERQGFRFHALGSPAEGTGGSRAAARARHNAALAGQGLPVFIDSFRPELFLVQSEMHAVILWLLGQGITPALIDPDINIRRVAGIPPPNTAFIPRGRWYDEIVSAALWSSTDARRRLRRAYMRRRLSGSDPWSTWAALCAKNGQRLIDVADQDRWPLLHYRHLEYLQLTAAEFDFPNAEVDSASHVGPMIFRDRREAHADADVQAARALLASRTDATPPLVVCVMGSILQLPAFYDRLVTAATGASFDLLIATGGKSWSPRSTPPNVHCFGYVPQLDVLSHASAAICHGGIATIHECIDAGVPMLVCSGKRMDENGNAARVVFHEAGLRSSLRARPAALRRHIDAVLTDVRYRGGVERLRRSVRYYETDGVAARRVERLLERSGHAPPRAHDDG